MTLGQDTGRRSLGTGRRILVRPARQEDIPRLAAELGKTNWEQVDLNRAIVFVAEEERGPVPQSGTGRGSVRPPRRAPDKKEGRRDDKDGSAPLYGESAAADESIRAGKEIAGFIAARLIWQVEPLFLFPAFRRQRPRNARRRATLLLARALEAFLADRARNPTGICSYFCFIKDRIFQKLAEHYGLVRIYRGGRFYGRDL